MMTVTPSDDEFRASAERLDAAAAGAKDTYGMVARLTLTDEERQGLLGALVMGFQYGQTRDPKPGQAYFTELFGYEDGSQYPPELAAVPAEVADAWDRASAFVSTPLARARLHDLCFEGRWGRVGDHARLAGEAYLDLASELTQAETSEQLQAVRALRQREALRRARALARLTNRADLGRQAAEAIVAALRDVLAAKPLDPGRAIVLVEVAIDEQLPVDEVEDLLALLRSETRDIIFTERVIRFQMERASDDETRSILRRELVAAWMQEAERSDPARRSWSLATAAARARDFGVADLLVDLTSKLQETKLEDHGLVQHRVSVPIDGYCGSLLPHSGTITRVIAPLGNSARSVCQSGIRRSLAYVPQG